VVRSTESRKAKCSFCHKSQDRVEKLIAGPEDVYICNECVALCVDILGEVLTSPAAPQVGSDTAVTT